VDIHNLFYLVFLTLVPFFELRWSIPVGLWSKPIEMPFVGAVNGLGLPATEVLSVVIVANVLLGIVLYLLLDSLVLFFTRAQFIKEIYEKIVARTQRRASNYVEKYGTIGLAVFIGIPLPGSGVWTGALAAHLFGVKFKRFVVAEILGVLIAATIVTAIVLGLLNGF
jgi:uncharacterized membrane protein